MKISIDEFANYISEQECVRIKDYEQFKRETKKLNKVIDDLTREVSKYVGELISFQEQYAKLEENYRELEYDYQIAKGMTGKD